jgi:hypothetical protein
VKFRLDERHQGDYTSLTDYVKDGGQIELFTEQQDASITWPVKLLMACDLREMTQILVRIRVEARPWK